ncbi:lipid II flippase MurJ [uncultured Bacteroides sp.]|uniref:lipid II flippase MurJ n=1 Tax=uncultured Bacteroides sp. TaxID=162156 RepID=UPI002610F050|nr:lipid II flippase MurJ [uncultured Bacteroides sp.]
MSRKIGTYKMGTYKKGAVYSSAFSVGTKLVAFVMQLLIAYYLGANTGTDIYFYLFNIAISIGGLVQTLNTSILIPKAMFLRHHESSEAEMQFHNSFLYTFLLLAAGVLVLFCIVGGRQAPEWIMNFPVQDIRGHITIYYLFFPLTLLVIANLYISEILVSFKYFTLGLSCNFLINLSGIVTLLLFGQRGEVSIVMYSSCCACLLNSLLLLWIMKKKLGWRFSLVKFALVRSLSKPLAGLAVNQGIIIFASTFPMYLLSQYQSGIITVVNYAQKFIQAPLALIQQITSVLQIKLNNLYGQGKKTEMYRVTYRVALRLFLFTTCTSLVIFLLRTFIADELFGLGKMPFEAMNKLSFLIGIMTFAMPFTAVSLACMKIYFTECRIRIYVAIMALSNLFSCVCYYFAIGEWEEYGYAVMYLLVEFVIMIGIVWFLKHRR